MSWPYALRLDSGLVLRVSERAGVESFQDFQDSRLKIQALGLIESGGLEALGRSRHEELKTLTLVWVGG